MQEIKRNSILHVDGSSLFRKVFAEMFHNQDFRYIDASNPEAARQILERDSSIRLIVTALEFEQGGSGVDFINELNNSKWGDIPIVVLTSSDSADLRDQLFGLGVVDYITKNRSPEQITEYMKLLYAERLEKEDLLIEGLKSLSIAVLDDSRVERNLIRNILEFHGITNVHYFETPSTLLEALDRGETFDIYLVDIILPESSGEEVILKLKRRRPEDVVIAISALDHIRAITSILLSGADDYILKPFNTNMFLARLKVAARTRILLQELNQRNQVLEELVVRDPLTGLFNHRYMHERLESEIRSSHRYHRVLSVMMLDLDDFKLVNDLHGHLVGDEILKLVSQKLIETFRETDIIGRYGGEEFMVILPFTDSINAHNSANRLLEKLANSPLSSASLKITLSGGVTQLVDETSGRAMIRKADTLLYQAKKDGNNRVYI